MALFDTTYGFLLVVLSNNVNNWNEQASSVQVQFWLGDVNERLVFH